MSRHDLPYRSWLPIAFVIFFTCAIININSPVLSAGTLRLICKELDLPRDCDDKIATQTQASWNMTVSMISGVVMFLTVGIWTATAHVIGRPKTIAIALFGIGTLDCVWGMIFRFEALQTHWRWFAGSAIAFNCCTGTMAVVLLGVFGAANDLTHKSKATRAWLFAILEGIIGSTAIVSSKFSSYLVKKPLYYTLYSASGLLYTMSFIVFMFYTNTVPEKDRQRKIHWNEATILTALLICIPTKKNIMRFLGKGGDVDPRDDEENDEDEENEESNDNNNNNNSAPLIDSDNSSNNNNNNNNKSTTVSSDESINAPLLSSTDTSDHNDIDIKQDEDNKQEKSTPILTSPYFFPFIAFGFLTTMFVLYGRKTILFLYFKTEYKIDNSDYANIMTLDAIGNAITVILVLPLIKKALIKYTKLRFGIELFVSALSLLVQATCYTILPYLPALIGAGGGEIHNNKIWAAFILLFIIGMFTSIPAGILRASIINTTKKRSQQHRIIACLAAIEGFCIISGGLVVNKVYKTFSFGGLAYVVIGGVYMTGAVLVFTVLMVWLFVDPKRWSVDLEWLNMMNKKELEKQENNQNLINKNNDNFDGSNQPILTISTSISNNGNINNIGGEDTPMTPAQQALIDDLQILDRPTQLT